MKRSGPPQRRTPLTGGKPLARGKPLQQGKPLAGGPPLKRSNGAGPHTGPWPSRSKPIKVKRDGARRRDREDQAHGIPWADVRLVIVARAGGRCEVCGAPITVASLEAHHRLARRYGADCPCNALALCSSCHHGPQVHAGPAQARENGLIISQHDQRPPSEVPAELARGLVTLTCGGAYQVGLRPPQIP